MLNNQAQAGRRVHRLDFFRSDQIVFLVSHQVTVNGQLPEGTLREWVDRLSSQISENEELSSRPAGEFVAELCDDEQLPENILTPWTNNLREQLKGIRIKGRVWELADTQPRSYSFPPVNSGQVEGVPLVDQQELFLRGFSIIAANLKQSGKSSNQDFASNIGLMEIDDDDDDDDDDRHEPDESNAGRVKRKRSLFNLIRILNQEGVRPSLASTELKVEAVFPNWIASSGGPGQRPQKSDSGGTGGPGSDPVPYTIPDPDKVPDPIKQIPYFFQDLIDQLKAKGLYGNGKKVDGQGKDIDVVILDTAPSGDDLVFAYKELVLKKPDNQKHPILKSLLETDGLLNLYPATFEARRRMGNTSLNHHGYKMPDHGLFIAGIINSIVPNATIHLIEVLNQFGVGDIETISRGFAKAYAIYRRNKRPLIVNCSLCLDLPELLKDFPSRESDEETIPSVDKEFRKALRITLKEDLNQEQSSRPGKKLQELLDDLPWVIGLKRVCELLDLVGGHVFAAAGNDSYQNQGGQRNAHTARYPAAFSKVTGVGALPQGDPTSNRHEASSFSNLADKPEETGIMTLGGEPGEEQGVLGLYLGEFPEISQEAGHTTGPNDEQTVQPAGNKTGDDIGWNRDPSSNKFGWAWWAGTSFATPILTAVFASVLSGPKNLNTVQAVRTELKGEGIIQPGVTPQNESGIPLSVRQSPNPNL